MGENGLGIKVSPSVGKLYQANYIPLLNKIKMELKKITETSLLARMNKHNKDGNTSENLV